MQSNINKMQCEIPEEEFTSGSRPLTYHEVEKIAKYLLSGTKIQPRIGIFAGPGLGTVSSILTSTVVFHYSDIPGFPVGTGQGNSETVRFGYIGLTPTVYMESRLHFYEGYPLWKRVLPVRVMKLLGVAVLLVLNVGRGINANLAISDLMLIYDHLNFASVAGFNPLRGPNEEKFGPRFVAMNDAYDKELRQLAKDTAKKLNMKIKEGVYGYVGGPTFETVTELRALETLGVDAVGMSTVPEIIAARHCGIRCIAFSLIADKCPLDYDNDEGLSHAEILDVAKCWEDDIKKFVRQLVKCFFERRVIRS